MMAFHHRKQLYECYDCTYPPPSPPPPPPSIDLSDGPNKNHHLSPFVILMFCVLGAAFLFVSYLTFAKRYYSNWNTSRRRNPSTFDDDQEDFVDENHGPVIDHHIWYINTVGLRQSIIDSIAVFKYKKDEGLIEGTDCPICLSEFQEDETLRLLPKCSHAFHIPCIDTWLRSHKNCPLCRAPIVSDANNTPAIASEQDLDHLGRREEIQVEDTDNYGTGGELGVGNENFGGLPSEEGTITEIITKDSRHFNTKNCEFRVLSDLADRRPKVEEELQPVRRSISMDASSASRIYLAVANIPQVELEGCSNTQLVRIKKPNSEKVAKVVNRNLSISKLINSSSVRCSLQKGPVAMKRSFSSTGKFSSLRRHSRSQDSITQSSTSQNNEVHE